MLLAASYYTRIIVRRRLKPGAGGFSAQHVDYYDVDSLDYGFNTASKGVAGAPSGSARLYPERWLMLFLYSLNMATLSVLASSLPSSQLPAQHLYGVEAYPIVTLMSVLVFLCLPATIVSSWLFSSYGIRGTCTIALGISVVGFDVAKALRALLGLFQHGRLLVGGNKLVLRHCPGHRCRRLARTGPKIENFAACWHRSCDELRNFCPGRMVHLERAGI